MTGTDFAQLLLPLSGQARDQALLAHADCLVPWPLVPVRYTRAGRVIEVQVTSDVLAMGTVDDPFRLPMGAPAVQAFADHLGLRLITRVVSDAIWAAAEVKIAPHPMSFSRDGGRWMLSSACFIEHNQHVEEARRGRTGLIAGHKKDVVLCSELALRADKVAIYGWHLLNGHPIQPLNARTHGAGYCDYSHGGRLMSPVVLIDGEEHDLDAVLADPRRAPLLTGDAAPAALAFRRYAVPSWAAIPTAPTEPPPAIDDAPTPDGEPALPVGLVALERLRGELGVHETPGPGTTPRVVEYGSGAMRAGKRLDLGNTDEPAWCAVLQGWAERGLPGALPWRWAVSERWADAAALGLTRPKSYRARAGDEAIFARGGGDPRHGGTGHDARVARDVDEAGSYATIGGNEGGAAHFGGAVLLTERTVDDPALVGWIVRT